ncbi:MAG: WYL domain-containing protein [Deltaproteobacteria bacterium]|nr:WYL domain-containing protein [Deltaproteobacteria bacterium]
MKEIKIRNKIEKERRTPTERILYLLLYLLYYSKKIKKRELLRVLGISARNLKSYRSRLNDFLRDFSENVLDIKDNCLKIIEEKDQGESYLFLSDLPQGSVDENIEKVISVFYAKAILSSLNITKIKENISDICSRLIGGLKYKFLYRTFLNNIDRIFYYHPYAPKNYKMHEDIINEIIKAIYNQKVIECRYSPLHDTERKSRTSFKLKPYSLVYFQSALYLLGEDEDGKIKTYSIDRFVSVKMTSNKYHYPDISKYHPKNYLNEFVGIIGEGDRVNFEIIFSADRPLQRNITERRWFLNQSFENLPDGRLKMSFTTCKTVEVKRWLLGFGKDVEIIKPSKEELDTI